MGSMYSRTYLSNNIPPTVPCKDEKPTFDSSFGFAKPRAERVSKLSYQEMRALQIPKSQRDYCAHFLKDYYVCYNYYKPIHGLCKPELEAYNDCEKEDFILRMKEYERERRLRIREEKLKGKTA